MNEKFAEMLEKLGYTYIGGNNKTTDELLAIFDLSVNDEGEIIDENGNATGYWYDEIEY